MSEEKKQCAYCRKERDIADLEPGTIICQGRDEHGFRGVVRKTGLYCKDKPCASYDQFAHEG